MTNSQTETATSGRTLLTVVVTAICVGLTLVASTSSVSAMAMPDPAYSDQSVIPQMGQLESAADGPFSTLNIVAVLASIAILFMFRQAWNARPRLTGIEQTTTTELPATLHPAYAGALASGRIRDSQLEAIVLELIRRGALLLEPDADERSKVQIRIIDAERAEILPEHQMIELLGKRTSDGVVTYRELKRLRNSWGNIRAQLQKDVATLGWLNPSLIQTRLPFILPGLIGLALSVALIIAALVAETGWPILGAIIVGGTGLITLTASSIAPDTTLDGERAAVRWRGLRAGLSQAREEAHGTLDLDLLFPYIVAMGLAAQFDRPLRRASQSGYIPVWIGRRKRVQEWPDGWHTYWIALHTALAPTDPINTTAPGGSIWRRSLTGGR